MNIFVSFSQKNPPRRLLRADSVRGVHAHKAGPVRKRRVHIVHCNLKESAYNKIPPQTEPEHNGKPHEAWRPYKKEIHKC